MPLWYSYVVIVTFGVGLPISANMKTLMKRAKFLIALLLASITALGGFTVLLPQQVSASPFSQSIGSFDNSGNDVAAQSRIWTEFWTAVGDGCQFNPHLNDADIAAGKWFVNKGSGGVNIGHHVDPQDGTLDCNNGSNWFSNLLNAAGYSNSNDIYGLAQQVFTISGGLYYPKGSVSNANNIMKAGLAKDLFHGNIPSDTPDYITYSILIQNFTAGNACNAVPTPSTGGLSSQYTGSKDISFYDEATGNVSVINYSYKDKTIGIGRGLLAFSNASDGRLACKSIATYLNNPAYANDLSTYITLAGGSTGTGNSDSSAPELECGTLKNPLNWVLCPIVQGVNAVIAQLDNAINSLLTVDQASIFDRGTDTGHGYYTAWSSFRVFALALLVIAALVMVIAQALGLEILDAYTIKKVLPRLIIAIIGISLSWYLMEFLVNLTNALGDGVRQLIYYPFHTIKTGNINLGGGSTVALSIISASAIWALGPLGIASFVATAALAVMIAFLVLILRQILIIVLILMAPIAIACYILPNTNSAWKLWSESLIKGLMMFPIIVSFLAAGRVLAVTASAGKSDTVPQSVYQLIAFAAYFMPYFLIPMTFRFAGGAMRFVGGAVNDRNRGGFDRLKKFRAGRVAQNMHDTKTGDRWGERGYTIKNGRFAGKRISPGNRVNAITKGIGTGYGGRFGLGARGAAAMDANRDGAAMEFMKDPKFISQSENDPVLRAAAVGRSEGQAAANLQRIFGMSREESITAAAQAKATIGFGSKQQQAAAMQLVNTGTGYDNIEQMTQTLSLAARGNAGTGSRLAGFANAKAKQTGRYDLAPSFGTMNGLVQRQIQGDAGTGAGPNMATFHAATVHAARGADAVTLLRGKPRQVEYLTQSLADNMQANWLRYNNATTPQDQAAAYDEVLQTAAQARQLDDSKTYASPEVQEHVNRMMNDMEPVRNIIRGQVTPPPVPAGAPFGTRAVPVTPAQVRWAQLAPTSRNPNDPNLP